MYVELSVRCKFCATGKLKRCRNLTDAEIIEQIEFVLSKNPSYLFDEAKEHKINYTRMGEPFLNIDAVKDTIDVIGSLYPTKDKNYMNFEEDLDPLYAEKFSDPKFNPRWSYGTAAYSVVMVKTLNDGLQIEQKATT
jgi:hypothetical protein